MSPHILSAFIIFLAYIALVWLTLHNIKEKDAKKKRGGANGKAAKKAKK